jgi:hypothetical protein
MMPMERRKGIITLLTIFLLLFSTFAVLSRNLMAPVNSYDGGAVLTGTISDWGKDTDGDGKFDYLEVAVEVDVSSYGYYRIEVQYLVNPLNYSYSVWRSNESYLDVGLQWLNLSFYGPAIYAAKFNVSGIGDISVYEDYGYFLDSLLNVPLSTVYNYTDFDCRAVFTGTIYDKGIDTDGDGLFNSLQVGVEVNVTEAAEYEVQVSNLYGNVSVDIYNYYTSFLEPGLQTINVSLSGATIYASHGNVSNVGSISLSILEKQDYYYYYYTLQYINGLPLNKTYSYDEFDPMAFFTGTILDEGIDEDHDGLSDYLEVSVEVNVTDAGYYRITVDNLYGNNSDSVYFQMSGIGQSFDVGVHLVNFTVYGPRIYGARIDPTYVGPVRLFYEYSPWEDILLEQNSKMRLSVPYHYYEFESHAFLTGKVYDSVADTDADSLWDYLEVGVEVNVTEAGVYRINIWELAEKLDTGYRYLYCSQYSDANLTTGVHVVNFTFSGPLIAYNHFNPTNASELGLWEASTGHQLSYVDMAPLSRRYNWTEFDQPLNDVQLEFTVYPDATVGVNGLINYTNIVYPPYYYPSMANATIGFSTIGSLTTGSANGTIMLPEYFREGPRPLFSISQEMLPSEYPYPWYEFLYNSTTVNFASQYYNDMLNAQLNATMNLPPEVSTAYPFNSSDFSFLGTYSNGMLNVDLSGETELPSFILSQFPFEMGDATVLADYKDNEISGNITFHTVSGFPLGDVIVHFNGNKTEISFTGNITVVYGNYFGTEINATVLEEMLTQINGTIPGQGENSLYNMTQGMIECTELNTTKTPIGLPEGARVDYNVTIHGNFTKLLAYVLTGSYATEETRAFAYAALDATLSSVDQASLTLNYYAGIKTATLHVTLRDDVKALLSNALELIPPTVPPLFAYMSPEYQEYYRNLTEALLKIANITAYAVENAYISVEYSSATQQLDVRTSLTANVTEMKNEIIPILPDTVPPEYFVKFPWIREFVESCTNTTYCTLDSLNITCNYVNGIIDFDAKWLLDGNFTAELNRMKHCYVEFLNLTSPYMINWQTLMINETEIDISNFKAEFRLGEDWMTLTFEGLKIHPPKDEIDPVRFQLYRLFNLTSSPYGEPPGEFQKLKITMIGGANATHTVLLYAPPIVPSPDDVSSDYKVMTWENTKISSLKDLVFQIAYQEVIPYLGKDYYVFIFTNSTESEFTHDFFNTNAPSISFNVSGATGMGFCNITIPRSLLDATMENWTVRIDGVPLLPENFNVTQNDDYVFIYLTYLHSVHTIEVVGTWVVTEFPPNMLPLILVILSFIAAIIVVKKRKRLNTLKTKYQGTINTLAKMLHQLRT